ncbi:hypothetical protein [Herbaspirillum huttiense]|uniref:hypothetical protein n=1 Tax=Herbaspirillum huttiense TaxID=863372 RepID=UPI0031E27104
MASFFKTITEAIRYYEEVGFDSVEKLETWIERIKKAAYAELVPEAVLNETLNAALRNIYTKQIDRGQILKMHPGASQFTVNKLKPKLRAELDRRVAISKGLIKLNRQQMIEKTTQRFAGWASSIPDGGSRAVEVKDVKDNIRKAMTQLPFEERRVLIDQGTKFVGALNEIIAQDGGAIAAQWHIHKAPGYKNRHNHEDRDGKVYAIRVNWAMEKGLMKAGPAGYYDDITKPGEEIFCSCGARYLYALRELPPDMLTIKGQEALDEVRKKRQAAN